MRAQLKEKLKALGTPGTWEHITEQIGMFSFTGLNRKYLLLVLHTLFITCLTTGHICSYTAVADALAADYYTLLQLKRNLWCGLKSVFEAF